MFLFWEHWRLGRFHASMVGWSGVNLFVASCLLTPLRPARVGLSLAWGGGGSPGAPHIVYMWGGCRGVRETGRSRHTASNKTSRLYIMNLGRTRQNRGKVSEFGLPSRPN